MRRMKYWEIIADNLSKAGWSWSSVATVNVRGRTIFVVDAHRDGRRFIVRADEKLSAFVELEWTISARPEHCGLSAAYAATRVTAFRSQITKAL
jgi:hypothetical protein